MIVGYTADPNCLMWLAAVSGCGGKTRPKTRPLEDKTKAVGALLKYPSRLHFLYFILLFSTLLFSTHLYSIPCSAKKHGANVIWVIDLTPSTKDMCNKTARGCGAYGANFDLPDEKTYGNTSYSHST